MGLVKEKIAVGHTEEEAGALHRDHVGDLCLGEGENMREDLDRFEEPDADERDPMRGVFRQAQGRHGKGDGQKACGEDGTVKHPEEEGA